MVAYTTTKTHFIQQETPAMSNNDRLTVPDGSVTVKRLYKAIILKAVTHKSNPLMGTTASKQIFPYDI